MSALDLPAEGPAGWDPRARALLAATERLDPAAIEAAIFRCLGAGAGWWVYASILAPVLAEVGRRWAEGALTVTHERLLSEAVGAALRDLIRRATPPPSAPTLLLACLDAEHHALPLYGVALMAAHAGWRPVVLGAGTPPEAVGEAAARLRPGAVALSATVPCPAEAFAPYLAAVQPLPVLVGGPGAEAHRDWLTARGARVARSAEDLPPLLAERAPPPRRRP